LNTPWPGVDHGIERSARALHRWLKINPDDARWSWAHQPFRMPWIWNQEDMAGSPIQTLLLLSCVPLAFLLSKERIAALMFMAALLSGIGLFCLLLRWAVYDNRLLLTALVLGAPLAGLVLENRWPGRATAVAMAALLAFAVPFVVHNYTSPLTGPRSIYSTRRIDQRFHGDGGARVRWQRLARRVRDSGCRHVGLLVDPNTVEYPLWVMLQKEVPGVRIEHVNVRNFTASLEKRPQFAHFAPYVLIRIRSLEEVRMIAPAPTRPEPVGPGPP
jgi:hypothetical protein